MNELNLEKLIKQANKLLELYGLKIERVEGSGKLIVYQGDNILECTSDSEMLKTFKVPADYQNKSVAIGLLRDEEQLTLSITLRGEKSQLKISVMNWQVNNQNNTVEILSTKEPHSEFEFKENSTPVTVKLKMMDSTDGIKIPGEIDKKSIYGCLLINSKPFIILSHDGVFVANTDDQGNLTDEFTKNNNYCSIDGLKNVIRIALASPFFETVFDGRQEEAFDFADTSIGSTIDANESEIKKNLTKKQASFLNKYLKMFGIRVEMDENGKMRTFHNDTELKCSNDAFDAFSLPIDFHFIKSVIVEEKGKAVLSFARQSRDRYDAESQYHFVVGEPLHYTDSNGKKHSISSQGPATRLNVYKYGKDNGFEMRPVFKDGDKYFVAGCREEDCRVVDSNCILEVDFIVPKAIVVYDGVILYKNIWGKDHRNVDEDADYLEIPYKGYKDFSKKFEFAMDYLITDGSNMNGIPYEENIDDKNVRKFFEKEKARFKELLEKRISNPVTQLGEEEKQYLKKPRPGVQE